MRRIYADAAAATPISKTARRELIRLLDVYGNAGALHHEAVVAKNELEAARASVAESIGVHADELVFTASGTEGNNLAIQGLLRPLLHSAQEKGERLHAITSCIEHSSVLEPLRAMKSEGLDLTELAVNSEGLIDLQEFAEAVQKNTVFVSVQWVNSEIGTMQPIKEIAKLLRKNPTKIYFHTDASQAPMWLAVKVESLGVDMLTLDAQKILGPKGVGALFVKRGLPLEPVLMGSKQERGLRGGTENVPLIGSFAVALKAAQKDVEKRFEKTAAVRDYLWAEIKKHVPDAVLNGPGWPNRVSNNLNLSIPGLDREMAVLGLDALGIAATTRSACNVADNDPSHVIAALGGPSDVVNGAIRLTLLPDATKAQARRIAKALAEVAQRYRIVVE